MCEDLLGLMPLETYSRGEVKYEVIKEMLTKRKIYLKQLASSLSHHRWCTCHGWEREGGCGTDETRQP